MKINKILLILAIIVIFMSFLYARTYSNRAIETTDQIIVTDSEGNDYLNKWSQVATFAEDNIDTISGDLVLSDSLYVTGNTVFNGEISDSTYFAYNVTIEGDLDVNGSSLVADSVYIGGNLRVDGNIYGYDAYDFAAITTKGDTMVVDSADVYRTIDCPFTNKYAYEFTATDSGIVYIGEATRIMEVVVAATYYTNKNTNVVTHGIEINDTLRVGSLSPFKTQTAGYYGLVNILGSQEIKTGDRIELVVASDTDDTEIVYPRYSTSIKVVR